MEIECMIQLNSVMRKLLCGAHKWIENLALSIIQSVTQMLVVFSSLVRETQTV